MPYIQAYSFQLHIYITRFLWAYSQTSTIHSGAKCLPRVENSHIGWATSMPLASINSTNPRTNPWNFHEKILRIGGAGKWEFFEAAILNFLSRPFWIFFCFISVKNPALLYEVPFFSALWMVFPESWKRSCPNFYAHDCTWYFVEERLSIFCLFRVICILKTIEVTLTSPFAGQPRL